VDGPSSSASGSRSSANDPRHRRALASDVVKEREGRSAMPTSGGTASFELLARRRARQGAGLFSDVVQFDVKRRAALEMRSISVSRSRWAGGEGQRSATETLISGRRGQRRRFNCAFDVALRKGPRQVPRLYQRGLAPPPITGVRILNTGTEAVTRVPGSKARTKTGPEPRDHGRRVAEHHRDASFQAADGLDRLQA